MLSETSSDRTALSAPRAAERAPYPKLRPGPSSAPVSVASNQRARLYAAMIELLAARGYQATTVAELCALAGVSKRTLYERFPGGKQECFLATYDIVVHRVRTRVLAALRCVPDTPARGLPTRRLQVCMEAFAHEVVAYPAAVRLVVVEARDAGPAAVGRAERTKRLVERLIAWGLRASRDAPAPSTRVVEWIAGEGARVTRARLLDGRVAALARQLCDLCLIGAALAVESDGGRLRSQREGLGEDIRETAPCGSADGELG
jgi:AcrR family transcriptional regulator